MGPPCRCNGCAENSQEFGVIYDIVSYDTPAKEIFSLLEAVDQFRQMYGGKASGRLESLIQDISKVVLNRENFK